MNKKIFLLLCLLITLTNVTKANEEEAPAEEAEGKAEAEGEGEEKTEEEEGNEEELEAEIEAEEEAEEGGAELTCNKQILETYGMVGLDEPRPMALDMCESVKHSCCHATDQLKIYENWMEAGEDADLVERFKYQMRVGIGFGGNIIGVQLSTRRTGQTPCNSIPYFPANEGSG
jgi:hypothetical protein